MRARTALAATRLAPIRAAWLALALAAILPSAAAAPSFGDELPPPSVRAQLERLKPQRPGVVDVYAVIVGADGEEDVFRREVTAVREVLDTRLDTGGRSVTLVNHRSAPQPEATLKSLEHVLNQVALRMDRNEDVLFLHITTHGSSNHVLSFRHPSDELYGLTPKHLQSLLAKAQIRNRVILISACYSGGFIAPLANPDTLIITAAELNRKSYGCGNDSEITDFSRAFYLKALRQTRSIPAAARIATQIIHGEERATKREHSYPQMQLGISMEERLRALEQRLSK